MVTDARRVTDLRPPHIRTVFVAFTWQSPVIFGVTHLDVTEQKIAIIPFLKQNRLPGFDELRGKHSEFLLAVIPGLQRRHQQLSHTSYGLSRKYIYSAASKASLYQNHLHRHRWFWFLFSPCFLLLSLWPLWVFKQWKRHFLINSGVDLPSKISPTAQLHI